MQHHPGRGQQSRCYRFASEPMEGASADVGQSVVIAGVKTDGIGTHIRDGLGQPFQPLQMLSPLIVCCANSRTLIAETALQLMPP